jgi:TRAP-type C4-dicarboxylate transport system permease small subunit
LPDYRRPVTRTPVKFFSGDIEGHTSRLFTSPGERGLLTVKIFSKIMSVLTKIMLTIGGIFCLFSMLLNSANAFMRYVFNSPIVFGDELAMYCVILMVFLTLPFLELHNEQLSISFILGPVKSEKGRTILIYFRGLVTLGLTSLMVIAGYDATMRSFNRNVITAILRLPKGALYGIVVVCFIIAAVSWILIMLRKGLYSSAA